ncbi:carbon storage regulator [Microbulbifer sp. SSSA007]|uniref:carbon storage regulator n=1 Tax=Microbulbifer sp. SSSA007 TaxID=3243379 RepID=UPI004039F3A9
MLPNQIVSSTALISAGNNILPLKHRVEKTLGIGANVSVMMLIAKGNQVKIGIHVPKYLSAHREEIYVRIKREREVGSGRR